ncbi:hypothetical protein [Brevibacillus sp. NRS-1366]|uniref:hypothetical protein n=1 Tax=Brevibacillus sp. NRS-1366 TaxID=3233899 RepID=UPI003D1A994D
MYTEVSKNFVTKLFNTLEVVEVGDKHSPYVLVEDNDEFRAICRGLRIGSSDIVNVTDGEMVDLLALGAITYGIGTYEDEKGFVVE